MALSLATQSGEISIVSPFYSSSTAAFRLYLAWLMQDARRSGKSVLRILKKKVRSICLPLAYFSGMYAMKAWLFFMMSMKFATDSSSYRGTVILRTALFSRTDFCSLNTAFKKSLLMQEAGGMQYCTEQSSQIQICHLRFSVMQAQKSALDLNRWERSRSCNVLSDRFCAIVKSDEFKSINYTSELCNYESD